MDIFDYTKAESPQRAIELAAQSNTAQQGASVRFIAGGTTLFDLMKLSVERPQHLVDINDLPFSGVERTSNSEMKIGALVRNSDLAHHPIVTEHYPVLSQALLSGASAQLRNMATVGGNLLQRTRCIYFRNIAMPCNKRDPGSGCPAITGDNRTLAILGGSQHCIATNPSDMNVALVALEATVHINGNGAERSVPIGDFHLLPGDTPQVETVLVPGDLVTHITVPTPRRRTKQIYLKLRDRASYEFALSSAAVVAEIADGHFREVRLAMGGVGTKPWRAVEAEAALSGAPVNNQSIEKAARIALAQARPQSGNGFKVELAQRCVAHALRQASGLVKA